MADDLKKYNYMENTLTDILGKFISLPIDEVMKNNCILESILSIIINKMKEKDPLFNQLFSRVFYGGSYYDGLRVGKPVEFDLDLLMTLPKEAEPVLITSNKPGFVHLNLSDYETFLKQPEAQTPAYKNFGKFLDKQKYLTTSSVLWWMEGVIHKALNDFTPGRNGKRILIISNNIFEIIVSKSGPAMTLKLSGPGVKIDVDLVASFEFGSEKWPVNGFKANPVASKPNFFIVPKKPKDAQDQQIVDRYWRLSFQEQERVLIDNKQRLKPTVKLLKKMRDNLQHYSIASYFIKTVILHIVEKKNTDFWNESLSYVFMTVLKEYKEYIDKRKIPYYWNKNNNLLSGISEISLQNISGRLQTVINSIEKHPEDPKIIAKFLLTPVEESNWLFGQMSL